MLDSSNRVRFRCPGKPVLYALSEKNAGLVCAVPPTDADFFSAHGDRFTPLSTDREGIVILAFD